jgi:glutamyl-tRNA reductase
VDPIIVALRDRTRAVLRGELERSLKGKLRHLGPEDREALEAMLDAATSKLLHPTIARLKRAAATEGEANLVDAASELLIDDERAVDGAGLRIVRGR